MSVSASVSVPMKKMKLMQCHKLTPTINITHMLRVQNTCGNSLQIILKKRDIINTYVAVHGLFKKRKYLREMSYQYLQNLDINI